jgi:hypothetical protein
VPRERQRQPHTELSERQQGSGTIIAPPKHPTSRYSV